MAVQNSKTSVAKSQSIKNLKGTLPHAFKVLEETKPKTPPLSDEEKAFIDYAIGEGFSQRVIAKALKRTRGMIENYLEKC